MARRFENSWLRIERGKERLERLNAAIAEVTDGHPPLEWKFKNHSPRVVTPGRVAFDTDLYVSNAPTLSIDPHGLLLGEAIHHFRASLDNAVWQLVKKRGTFPLPANKAKHVAYPMARNRKNYWCNAGRLLPGVADRPYLTFIERYQPYRRTTYARALRALHLLSNTDKHRAIVPALIVPSKIDGQFQYEGGTILDSKTLLKPGRSITPNTKLFRLSVERDVGWPIEMKVQANFLFEPELPKRLPLVFCTNGILATCAHIVGELENLN